MPYVDPALISSSVLNAAVDYAAQHGGEIRETAGQPHPPYPSPDNPMLRYLVEGAQAMLESGMDPETAVLQAVVHAWFEGNIEGREQASGV